MGNTVTPLRNSSTTRVWRLRNAPVADIEESTFEIGTEELPQLQRDDVLVQTIHLSNGKYLSHLLKSSVDSMAQTPRNDHTSRRMQTPRGRMLHQFVRVASWYVEFG